VGFTASGSALSTTITATAQSGYQVSTSLASGYAASVSVASGTTVYVRFAASRAAGTYNNATAVVLSSTGATDQNVTTSSSGNTVSQKALTISGASATNRAYNATTAVAVSGGSLVGVESGDTVTLSAASASGSVATAIVGDGKAVTVTGYSISGASSGNYSLTQPTGLTVNITKANPTITANPTASGILYAQALSASSFSGGTTTPSGTWTWNTPSTIPAPGTASYPATFTPSDTTNYNTGSANISVTSTMAQARNKNGAASPAQPSGIFLGDKDLTFEAETWGDVGGNWGQARLYIRHENADVSGGSSTAWPADFSNAALRTINNSPQFTNTGTWYWAIRMNYSTPYGSDFWYKSSNAGWTDMSANGAGDTANGWNEWSRHVLEELKRLDAGQQKLADKLDLKIEYLCSVSTREDFDLCLKDILARQPDLASLDAVQRMNLFEMWLRLGDVEALMAAIESNKTWERDGGWKLLAEHYAKKSDFRRACEIANIYLPSLIRTTPGTSTDVQALERAFLFNPLDSRLGIDLFQAYKSRNEFDAAIRTLEKVKNTTYPPAYLHQEMAAIFMAKEDFRRAWEHFREAASQKVN
jgi:tetratricopeptide (TPR) repeat protein